jgi:hypothetical protein
MELIEEHFDGCAKSESNWGFPEREASTEVRTSEERS